MTVITRDNMKNFFFSYLEKYEGKKSAVIPIMNRNWLYSTIVQTNLHVL